MITRIALYATLGFLLDALGHNWDTWQFWSIVALFWASDIMARREGYTEAIQDLLELMRTHQTALEDLHRKLKELVRDQ
jgi:hypothetical protein